MSDGWKRNGQWIKEQMPEPLDFSNKPPDWDVLLSAIDRAEGGNKARKPYGVLSTPVKDKADARQIALNTVKNNYQRWNAAGKPGDYISFLASRYVPASDDPVGHKNWVKNVPAIYAQLASKKPEAKKPEPIPVAPLNPLLLQPLPPVTLPVLPHYPVPPR